MYDIQNSIKNAIMRKSLLGRIHFNNFNLRICKTLFKNGFLTHYKVTLHNKYKVIIFFLKYYAKKNLLCNIKCISTYSRIITTNSKNVFLKKNSLLISNDNGLLLQSNIKKYNIGGKVLFFINC